MHGHFGGGGVLEGGPGGRGGLAGGGPGGRGGIRGYWARHLARTASISFRLLSQDTQSRCNLYWPYVWPSRHRGQLGLEFIFLKESRCSKNIDILNNKLAKQAKANNTYCFKIFNIKEYQFDKFMDMVGLMQIYLFIPRFPYYISIILRENFRNRKIKIHKLDL